VEDLPAEAIVYLLGSRYCETDRLSDVAWKLFEKTTPGWPRVQAICDFVHNHIAFGYEHARATMTAWEAFNEGKGVCRDYAHLAIAFCRCMNIPARYCTGYLGDIGMPPPYAAGDFAGWFEAYLSFKRPAVKPESGERSERGEATLLEAAEALAVSTSTVLRMIRAGILPANQLCKGAPWIIRHCDLQHNDVRREAMARRTRHPVSCDPLQQTLDL
jgi:hypothetical protein